MADGRDDALNVHAQLKKQLPTNDIIVVIVPFPTLQPLSNAWSSNFFVIHKILGVVTNSASTF